MSHYLNPKSDLIFKRIFAEHPNLLKSFLNAVLPLPADRPIESLEYLPTENVPEIPEFKYSVVDVRCTDTHGRHFIVEMQLQWSKHFVQRMLFNTASVYVRQLKKAVTYKSLSPIYGLAIVDADFTDEDEWFHHFQLTHERNKTKKLDDIQLIFLELPKFKPITIAQKKLSILWLRFLTEIDEKTSTVAQELLESPEIQEALALTEVAAYSPEELQAYERNWDAIRAENTLLEDKLEEGLAKGLEQGLEQGRKEIARNSLIKGFDVNMVVDITGLDLAAVLKIQETLK